MIITTIISKNPPAVPFKTMEYLTTNDELAAQTGGGDYVDEADLPQNTREFFVEADMVRSSLSDITADFASEADSFLHARKQKAEAVQKILRTYQEQPGLLDGSLMWMLESLFRPLILAAEREDDTAML